MGSAAIEVERIEVVGVSGQRVAWNIFAVCGMKHGPTTTIAYRPLYAKALLIRTCTPLVVAQAGQGLGNSEAGQS